VTGSISKLLQIEGKNGTWKEIPNKNPKSDQKKIQKLFFAFFSRLEFNQIKN
jgi:hypothetical protein